LGAISAYDLPHATTSLVITVVAVLWARYSIFNAFLLGAITPESLAPLFGKKLSPSLGYSTWSIDFNPL